MPGGIRTRILVWYVVLLTLSVAFMVIGLRQILTTQLASDIDAALAQEVEEVRRLAGGVNPATDTPFGDDAAAIFDTFFLHSVPGEYEVLYAIVDGQPYKRTVARASLFDDPAVLAAWRAASAPTSGARGDQRRACALAGRPAGGGPAPGRRVRGGVLRGGTSRPDRPDRAGDAGRLGGGHPSATVLAWGPAGRAIAPLRTLTATARGIGGRDLGARIPVEGTDEVAELTATLNSMLSASRRRSRRSATSSTTWATSCARR